MGTHVNYSGLVVAGVGFFLTRFTVTLALYQEPVRFYLAGVVPLALGLGLAAFGVAVAVADVDPGLVRTTALWCVVGTGTMLVLVVLTLLGSTAGEMPALATARSQAYLSNFLIGGSVGGTLTGLYAARTRRQRAELGQQTHRLQTLNRLLRHEVLNAVTAIRGYAPLRGDGGLDAESVIEEYALDIERTIEEVKYLTRTAGTSEIGSGSVDLAASLDEAVERVGTTHPAATITVDDLPADLTVRANDRLVQVFAHLLENAVVHGTTDGGTVDVSVTATANRVRVAVDDEGPGLPDSQRALLEDGEIAAFDDPTSGFGLNIVRLLVESYGGSVETAVDDAGTTITVVLPRVGEDGTGLRSSSPALSGVRPALPHLVVTLGAALVAGVVYGVVSEGLGGSVSGIGVFYGVQSAVVGWITHEFHSVVFGFVFAGLVSLAPARFRNHFPAYVAIGVAWGVVVWFAAAGFVAPLWLQLLGFSASLPTFSGRLLVNHLAWGVSLGALTAWGYRHVVPWLSGYERRFWRRVKRL